jgi:hypothetical protein
MNDIMPGDGIGSTAHSIPGWDRPAWAVRGVRADTELTWERDSLTDVTVLEDIGVEETFAPRLFRTDVVHVADTTVTVTTGEVRIRFCGDATTRPIEARKLAEALTELADWADGLR